MAKRKIHKQLNILSLGVGVQSTALYYMSALNLIERFDYAIFADPGSEKQHTYATLCKLILWGKRNNGPEIIVCGKDTLYRDLLEKEKIPGKTFVSIPAFTPGSTGRASMVRRQCTNEYKILEVNKAIRKIYGIDKYKWTPPTRIHIGITTDEISRMKQPTRNWQTFVYLFCNYSTTRKDTLKLGYPKTFSRQDCIDWLQENNFEVPVPSSCTFCPFQSNRDWAILKKDNPAEFQAAVELDNSIRDSTARGIKQPIFLHRSLKPLSTIEFGENNSDLFDQCDSGFCNT